MTVHSALGPGLLESVYKECLYQELLSCGLVVEKEKPIPLIYKEFKTERGYRIDLLVENQVVLEIKAVEAISDIHIAQTLTYLKLARIRIALIFNFNTVHLKTGMKRLVNGY
jgi:GxxExxY protein